VTPPSGAIQSVRRRSVDFVWRTADEIYTKRRLAGPTAPASVKVTWGWLKSWANLVLLIGIYSQNIGPT
jgi:hypothetical protein